MIIRFSRPRAVLFAVSLAGAVALALALVPTAALAQQSNNNFFGNLFKPPGQVGQQQQGGYGQQGASPETDPGELTVRIDRLENQIRQLTGQIEQLQYRNQQLEGQVKRYEMELDYRGGAQPAPGGPAPTTTGGMPPARTPAAAGGGVPPIMTPPVGAPAPGRRSDAFDPNANPGAPGMPQQLGTTLPSPAAAPGGAPVDAGGPRPGGTQVATLPPTNSPKDLYDLAYGYVLRQEYAQAGESFRAFLEQYPSDRAAPDAYYWLGESDYLRQQYKEAAQSFLKVSTDYPNATKAPDALLRLGQSLAAIGETDAACATFNAIGNKYPRASANVRQAVEREQKRVRC